MSSKRQRKARREYRQWLQASQPAIDSLLLADGELEILAAEQAPEGEKPRLRKFSMTAYTGGAINVGFGRPVVIDLAGTEVPRQSIPIFAHHNPERIVGHTVKVEKTAATLKASGIISGVSDDAQQVLALNDNGFPWQASVGMSVGKLEYVDAGQSVKVNGRNFSGPVIVARQTVLNEISFVPLGADNKTSATVAATQPKGRTMNEFEKWLSAKGFDVESLSDEQQTALRAAFDAEQNPVKPQPPEQPAASDIEAEMNRKAAENLARINRINELCAAFPRGAVAKLSAADGRPEETVQERALACGWNAERTELELMRRDRPTNAAIHAGGGAGYQPAANDVLVAAACQSGSLHDLDSHFSDQTLQAAHDRFRGRMGLQRLLLECAMRNGYHAPPGRLMDSDLEPMLRAAFSTIEVSGILSNIANKFLLQGFMTVERTWRNICAVRSVSDFKTITSYRMTGDLQYKQVGPGGEIEHGTLGEQVYTNKADTYARMLSVTRTDMINDDLGALSDIPARLGRGSALKINDVFWTVFCDHAAFFNAGNKNYAGGAGTALSIDSLTQAELLFLDQVDYDGKPLGIMPAILLVPNALNAKAAQLMNSTEIRETATNKTYGVTNPHAGKFRTERSSYLGNAAYGNSATAWYLLADPAEEAVIEVAFLNGVETPTVESAAADFNRLGIQLRGYHDFGVALREPKAGVKMLGTAE